MQRSGLGACWPTRNPANPTRCASRVGKAHSTVSRAQQTARAKHQTTKPMREKPPEEALSCVVGVCCLPSVSPQPRQHLARHPNMSRERSQGHTHHTHRHLPAKRQAGCTSVACHYRSIYRIQLCCARVSGVMHNQSMHVHACVLVLPLLACGGGSNAGR